MIDVPGTGLPELFSGYSKLGPPKCDAFLAKKANKKWPFASKHREMKKAAASNHTIENRIYLIREQRVMLDMDLAEIYGVQTKALNQAIKRNQERFPIDFVFQLNRKEMDEWRSQLVTSNLSLRMGLRRPPFRPPIKPRPSRRLFTRAGANLRHRCHLVSRISRNLGRPPNFTERSLDFEIEMCFILCYTMCWRETVYENLRSEDPNLSAESSIRKP